MGAPRRTGETSVRRVWWLPRMVALVGAIGLMASLGMFGGAMSASAATSYQVTATVPVGNNPFGVAVDATTHTVYVANSDGNSVSVIDGATPVTVAGAPTAVSATAGNGQASVVFTAPASNGGSAITGYTVTATDTTTPGNGGQTVTGTGSPLVVTGLTNGDSYTFTVTATNAQGTGPASTASTPVTPVTPTATVAGASVGATVNTGGTVANTLAPALGWTLTTAAGMALLAAAGFVLWCRRWTRRRLA